MEPKNGCTSRPHDDQALAALIGGLSPEAREAFVGVYELLLEWGLRDLAEHPERVPEMARRALRRSQERARSGGIGGDQEQPGTCVE